MKHISEIDLKFIAENLSLRPEIAKSLTEEENDCNLLLNELSTKNFNRAQILPLTFITFCKLVTYKYSYKSNFSLEDKTYIAKAIFFDFPKIRRMVNFSLIGQKEPTETVARYYLILAGLYYKKIKQCFFPKDYLKFIEFGFRKNDDLRELGINTEHWLKILRQIENDGWFNKNKEMIKTEDAILRQEESCVI